MPAFLTRSRLILVLLVGTVAGTMIWFWWLATRDQQARFLTTRQPADWILYPIPPRAIGPPILDRTTVFRRTFDWQGATQPATLHVRAFGTAQVRLNGISFDLGTHLPANWKEPERATLSDAIRQGENEIVATVTNDRGPPALWLVLSAGDWSLGTNPEWTATQWGAAARYAARATDAPEIASATPIAEGEQTLPALLARWPTLLLFGLGGGMILAVVKYLDRRGRRQGALLDRLTSWPVAVGTVALFWMVLFVQNYPAAPFAFGFDFKHHLDFIKYIQDYKKLPLVYEGWEMQQPWDPLESTCRHASLSIL